jgi:hypothetical protein
VRGYRSKIKQDHQEITSRQDRGEDQSREREKNKENTRSQIKTTIQTEETVDQRQERNLTKVAGKDFCHTNVMTYAEEVVA